MVDKEIIIIKEARLKDKLNQYEKIIEKLNKCLHNFNKTTEVYLRTINLYKGYLKEKRILKKELNKIKDKIYYDKKRKNY